ncbi:ABC transporter permease subunit [Mesorhizobium australicum]|uniref:ABC transporter permease n=1 Tax=Mesorhizobium australicum TaxID=536018 RepID=UPI003339CDD9
MKVGKAPALLLLPGLVLFSALLVLPLANTVLVSFRQYTPGEIGASDSAPLTLANYIELLHPAYYFYFFQTYWISFLATIISLTVGFPIAYVIARLPSGWARKLLVSFLVMVMFLGGLVRVYSVALTFGPVGFLVPLAHLIHVNPNSGIMIEIVTIIGLLHYSIPLSALVLIGTIQNINPRLAEAAETLGAPRWKAHLSVTVPLAKKGLMETFLLGYTLCISAFVTPMILGQGRLSFVSNLVYNRFSEVADYPSGAAIAVVMVVVSIGIVVVLTSIGNRDQQDDTR